jgi:hypothetical protein
LEVKGWKKIFHENEEHKAEVTILITDKINTKMDISANEDIS